MHKADVQVSHYTSAYQAVSCSSIAGLHCTRAVLMVIGNCQVRVEAVKPGSLMFNVAVQKDIWASASMRKALP